MFDAAKEFNDRLSKLMLIASSQNQNKDLSMMLGNFVIVAHIYIDQLKQQIYELQNQINENNTEHQLEILNINKRFVNLLKSARIDDVDGYRQYLL